MQKEYDIAILGSGPGGYVAASFAGEHGLVVALIEKEERLGGVCLHEGCIPTKFFLHQSKIYTHFIHSKDYGIDIDNLRFDFKQVYEKKKQVITKLASQIDFLMKKNHVDVYHGKGSFVSKNEIEINGSHKITAKNIMIATGSFPKSLPIIKGNRVLTSRETLLLEDVPKSIIIIGGGSIGCEFATMYNNYGSKVTLLEALPRIVPTCDEDISSILTRSFQKKGINIFTEISINEYRENNDKVFLNFYDKNKEKKEIEADFVLVSIGRQANIKDIGIENIGIKIKNNNIEVNEFNQTNIQNIYAIGDVLHTPQLAHVASHQGIIAVNNILSKKPKPINYDNIPFCIYSEPEIAYVGLTEKLARDRGLPISIQKMQSKFLGKAVSLGANDGFIKMIINNETKKILGVHILGESATELISECVSLLEKQCEINELVNIIHPHPTLAEAIWETARIFK
jgi:dihydrolipoamide dehydrogenase